jgi:hypothetical protein
MPVAEQKGDPPDAPVRRAAEVHLMRLPDSRAAKKKAPYIIHQVITGKDAQPEGQRPQASTVIRSIFCVYNGDTESEGALMLLNLMERLRIHLLRKIIIGDQFSIDVHAGIEMVIYPEDTAPYYNGEMISTWVMPRVQREVDFDGKIHG